MKMLSEDKCPICESTAIAPFCQCDDHLTDGGTFTICRCAGCGFLFTNPYPAIEDIERFYESDEYVPVSNTSKGLINKCYHLARWVMLRAKRRSVYKMTGKHSGRCLDIGCGTGEFAATMSEAGWAVTGVEPFGAARESAIERFGLNIVDITEQSDLPDRAFDLITLWHVLEHAHDLNKSMREINRLLAEGGTVIIGVPNHTSYDAAVYGLKWVAYDVPRHLYHFSPAAMETLATKHGFRVVALKPLLFDPLYIPLLTEKARSDRSWLRGFAVAFVSFWVSLFNPGRCTAIAYVLKRDDDR